MLRAAKYFYGTSMKRFACLLIIIIAAVPVFAMADGQRLVPAGHWVYDSLWKISLELGEVNLANSAPLSRAEISLFLEALNTAALSKAGLAEKERIEKYLGKTALSYQAFPFTIGIEPSIHLEAYYKPNGDIPWLYGFNEKKHLVDLPVLVSLDNYISIESNFFLANNYWTTLENDNFGNIPIGPMDTDIHFPDYAYFSFGIPIGGVFSLSGQLGKGSVSIGRTELGSIIFDKNFYHDAYATLSLHSPGFNLTAYTVQIEVNRYLYLHKIDLNFKKIQVSVLEGSLINAPIELRFLNPLMVFHNYAPWRSYGDYSDDHNGPNKVRVASYFAASIDYNPWKYFRIYAMTAFNQMQIPFEKIHFGNAAASLPDSYSIQAGAEFAFPLDEAYLHGGFEGVFTRPWMYIDVEKDCSFYSKRLDLIKNTSQEIRTWLGFPFGPDAIAATAYLGYEKGGDWGAKCSYSVLIQGEMSGDKGFEVLEEPGFYPDEPEKAHWNTPHGTAQYTHTFRLKGFYAPLACLELSSQLAYSYIINYDNKKNKTASGVELALSATIKLP